MHLEMTTAQQQQPISDIAPDVAFVAELYAGGGPTPQDYDSFDEWMETLFERHDSGAVSDSCVNTIRHAMPRAWTPETCQGRAYSKLHGYAGDFEIIDWIYQQHTTSTPELARWDEYFHQCDAPTAVRNRKEHFKASLSQRLEQHAGPEPLRVLDLASGPCRDVAEFFAEHPDAPVDLVCVDQDPRAIRFATNLCRSHLDRITFIERNAFRFRSAEKFDWLWAAGLFDYLTDRHFVRLLARLRSLAAPEAQIVVGNFNIENPSRNYMRLGEWDLLHRSEEQLHQLALQSGAAAEAISVEREDTGVNLFLTIDCSLESD